jgi:hypothetical protein
MDSGLEKLLSALADIASDNDYYDTSKQSKVRDAAKEYLLYGSALIPGKVSLLVKNGYKLHKDLNRSVNHVGIQTPYGVVYFLTYSEEVAKIGKYKHMDLSKVKEATRALAKDATEIAGPNDLGERTSLRKDIKGFIKSIFGR